MATKIINPGTDRYKMTCTECGCRFSYERSDVRRNFRSDSEDVLCPHCEHSCRHFGASGMQWRSGGGDRSCRFWS